MPLCLVFDESLTLKSGRKVTIEQVARKRYPRKELYDFKEREIKGNDCLPIGEKAEKEFQEKEKVIQSTNT